MDASKNYPDTREYTCPGCKKTVRSKRIGNSISYEVSHPKQTEAEEELEDEVSEDGKKKKKKCRYPGPVTGLLR